MPLNVLANDGQQHAERAAEQAIEDQAAADKKAVAEQQEVRDKLTAEAHAQNTARLAAYYANQDIHGLPAAPKAPALIEQAGNPDQKAQQEAQGRQALTAYKETGFLATQDIVHSAGMNPAEQALAAEKTFRERQQQLADKINDPETSQEQRQRLELVKTAEYHSHKADQMANIVSMERKMQGYSMGNKATSDSIIRERKQQCDHHTSQAALAAQQLHQFDQARNAVPKEVQARMGHAAQPHIQHNEQSHRALARDLDLQGSAHKKDLPEANNPVAARMLARIEAAGKRNDATKTPALDDRMKDIGASRDKLVESREQQKADTLARRANTEQQHATFRR